MLSMLDFLKLVVEVFFKGGWLIVAVGLIRMFYVLYIDYIQINWYNHQEWVFLKVTAPKQNEKSPLAFEQIFNHLHSMQGAITWAEAHIEGQFQPWFTWETVSVGGVIDNYVKLMTKFRDTFESAVYAQFPAAEITEAEDYLAKLPHYNPETSDFDIYGLSWRYLRPNYYPVRTYYDFEHSATDTFVDPVTGLWEELGKLNPYEMLIMQYIIRPINDDDWKAPGYQLIKKLKGEAEALAEPEEPAGKILSMIFGPFIDIIIRRTKPERPIYKPELPPSLMLHLSEGEKDIINAVEKKLSRLAYQVKITFLYVAPKEKFAPRPVWGAVVGAMKSINAYNLNALKPDTHRWTRVTYWAFEELEKPIVRLRLNTRKREFMKRVKKRFYFWGPPPNVMSTEELATILHFPQILESAVLVPQIDKVSVTKAQPPPELPIAPL